MIVLGGILAIHIIILTGFLLWKKSYPSITFLAMGIIMFMLAYLFNINGYRMNDGDNFLNALFGYVYDVFKSRLLEAGLLIMLFGGYIEYMKKIKASDAIVYVMMRPVSALKNYPYLSSIIIIPIGILIYFAIPSATAMGLLLMATIYPILLGIGLSKTSSLSVISACTIFDIGIASWNSNTAAEILNIDITQYFSTQLSMMAPLVIILMISIYFSNKYFDAKDLKKNIAVKPFMIKIDEWVGNAPLVYAIFPLLPVFILLIFPNHTRVTSNLSAAIIISFFIAGMIDSAMKKSVLIGFRTMSCFWNGFGRTCMSVVALMICADVFSQGLIKMGFIDFIVMLLSSISVGKFISMILLGIATFFSVLVVGSGVSFFAAISPLLSEWANNIGISTFALTISLQLIVGFARTASPIAVVVITISKMAGISPMELVKRNIIPMLFLSIILMIITYLFIN